MIVFNPNECADQISTAGPGYDPGRWVATYPYFNAESKLWPFYVDVYQGKVNAIAIKDPSIKTDKGVGLQSSIEQVEAAYPNLVNGSETDHSYVRYIADGNTVLSFEFAKPGIDPASDNRVLYLMVSPFTGTSPGTVAFTDGGVGSCI